jgi:hypothetical protein
MIQQHFVILLEPGARQGGCQHSLDGVLLVSVIPHSSEVQQPEHATIVLSERLHIRGATSFGREQECASKLHPGGPPKSVDHWAAGW